MLSSILVLVAVLAERRLVIYWAVELRLNIGERARQHVLKVWKRWRQPYECNEWKKSKKWFDQAMNNETVNFKVERTHCNCSRDIRHIAVCIKRSKVQLQTKLKVSLKNFVLLHKSLELGVVNVSNASKSLAQDFVSARARWSNLYLYILGPVQEVNSSKP